jgi:hypothetical protein
MFEQDPQALVFETLDHQLTLVNWRPLCSNLAFRDSLGKKLRRATRDGYAVFRRFSFMRPARTCARSYCACWTSQLSTLPPKALDKRTAISGDMPRFPLTSSESVFRVTPSAPGGLCDGQFQRLDALLQHNGARVGWVFHHHGPFSGFSGNRHNQHPRRGRHKSGKSPAS